MRSLSSRSNMMEFIDLSDAYLNLKHFASIGELALETDDNGYVLTLFREDGSYTEAQHPTICGCLRSLKEELNQ